MDMTVSQLIDELRAYDPDAKIMAICAVEKDGSLSLTSNLGVQRGESQDFEGLDSDGEAEFDDVEYVILMPMEGPWVEGKIKRLDGKEKDENSPSG